MKKEHFLSDLNDEQYAAVKVVKNSVVSAGAGSGKTRVLAKRFVNLIVEKKLSVDKIVALTFSKKAATEMSERIFEALSTLAEQTKTPELKKAVEDFNKAQVSTIDSFCATIARTGCSQFGISPDFKIDKAASDKLADTVALNFFLKHRDEPVLQKVLADHNIEDFVSGCFAKILKNYSLITKPLDLDNSIHKQNKKIVLLFEKYMTSLSKEIQIIESLESNKSEFCDTVKSNINQLGQTPKSVGDKIFESFLEKLHKVANISIQHLKRDEVTKTCKEAIKQIRNITIDLLALLNYVNNVPLTIQLFEFIKELQKDFISQKRALGVLSYSDVAQLAVDVLVNDIDVRNFYKNRIDAVMIDEFQDNNRLQRDLLFLLTEKSDRVELSIPNPDELCEDKLFFVGDDKQSIYLFRGADVSVFKKLNREITNDEDSVINLATNYRSETGMLNIFNYVFKSVFYSDEHLPSDEIEESMLEHESFFEPVLSIRNTAGVNPELKILIADGARLKFADLDASNPNLSDEECEAATLVNEIKKMKESKTQVRAESQARDCRWSDFAVLFRTTGNQAIVERYLRKAGIPYRAVQQKGLFYDAPINDIVALLRLAVYPWDKLGYAQVLRSPFINISDNAFTEILLQDFEPFDNQADKFLQGADLEGFIKGRALFTRIKQCIKEKTNAEIISSLWYDEAYRYLILTNENYHRYIELYDYLFEIARQADDNGLSVVAFLDLLEGYIVDGDKLEDLDIPGEENGDAVQLLTIHKSKGLEYPVVCIPFCGYEGRPNKHDDFVFYSDDLGLSIVLPESEKDFFKDVSPNIFFDELKQIENHKHIAEVKRLLYVAMTRAESHIIMTGKKINRKKKDPELKGERSLSELRDLFKFPEVKTSLTSFFNLLIPGLYEDDDEFKNLNIQVSEIMPITSSEVVSMFAGAKQKNKKVMTQAEIEKAYKKATLKIFPEPEKKVFAASHLHDCESQDYKQNYPTKKQNDSFDDLNNFDAHDETGSEKIAATDIGTLTHLAIEYFFKKKTLALPAKHEEEILKMRDTFFESKLGQKAVSATVRNTEYGFITKYDGKKVIGQIDLMFEADNIVYIVDYKTDKQEIPENHKEQLSVYKKAVTDLYKIKGKQNLPVKTFLFYLRSGNVQEI